MSDGKQKKQLVFFSPGMLPMGVGIGLGMWAGRLAGDVVRDVVGWWGSLAVGGLTAMAVALVTFYVVQAFVRRWD